MLNTNQNTQGIDIKDIIIGSHIEDTTIEGTTIVKVD